MNELTPAQKQVIQDEAAAEARAKAAKVTPAATTETKEAREAREARETAALPGYRLGPDGKERKPDYANRASFQKFVDEYDGRQSIRLDDAALHDGDAEKPFLAFTTGADGAIYQTDDSVKLKEQKRETKSVSLTLSQTAIDELAGFVAMPRIVAGSLTGPTKLELAEALADKVTVVKAPEVKVAEPRRKAGAPFGSTHA